MIAVDPPELSFVAERATVDAALGAFAKRYLCSIEGPVAEAVSYSMLGEGKRLRAILLLAAYRSAGGNGDASPLAAAPSASARTLREAERAIGETLEHHAHLRLRPAAVR